MFGGWIEAGWIAHQTETCTLEPYLRSTYISGQQNGYTDKGGAAPMSVSDNHTDNWIMEGGARINRSWTYENAKALRVELKAAAQGELLDTRVTVNSVVAGASQRIESPDADRIALIIGARADWMLSDALNIGVGYEPTFAGNWNNHLIDCTLKYTF